MKLFVAKSYRRKSTMAVLEYYTAHQHLPPGFTAASLADESNRSNFRTNRV